MVRPDGLLKFCLLPYYKPFITHFCVETDEKSTGKTSDRFAEGNSDKLTSQPLLEILRGEDLFCPL